jgi:uncharacterized membrane protein YhaH (DUF805 family)
MWLGLLVILCWMVFIALVMLGIDGMFGNPVKTLHFNVNDICAYVDPDVLRAAIARLRDGKEASPAHLVLTFLHGAGTLIFAWVYLAISVKRLHDRDRSGWWMIPYFIIPGLYAQFQDRLPNSYFVLPLTVAVVIFMIGGFIDIFCLLGTRWTNRFGPSPLPKTQTRARTTSAPSWDQTSAIEFVPHHASSPPAMRVKRGT